MPFEPTGFPPEPKGEPILPLFELPPRISRERLSWQTGWAMVLGLSAGVGLTLFLALSIWLGNRPLTEDAPGPVHVCADSTLRDLFPTLASSWKKAQRGDLTLEYGSSSLLSDRYLQGLPCDLLVSGDRNWVSALAAIQAVDDRKAVELARTELVVAIRKGTPRPGGVADLVGPTCPHIAIGAEASPLGEYARHCLEGTPYWNALVPRLVRGSDPRQVRDLLQKGVVEAALTTRAEVEGTSDLEVAFAFPREQSGDVVYVGVVTGRASHPFAAARLLTWLREDPEARKGFGSAGLEPPFPMGVAAGG